MAGKARDVKPTGPEGLTARRRSLVAQVGGARRSPRRRQAAGDQRDRAAVAVAVRVPGRSARATGSSPTASWWCPVDTTVVLHVTSTDVMHRWFVPALGGQVDAVPGKTAETWFRADREGVYRASRPSSRAPPTRRCGPGCGWSAPTPTSSSCERKRRDWPRPRSTSSGRSTQSAIPGAAAVTPPTDRPAPPRGRHRGDPAPPGRLDRASDQRRPQVGRDPLPRRLAVLPRRRGGRARAA